MAELDDTRTTAGALLAAMLRQVWTAMCDSGATDKEAVALVPALFTPDPERGWVAVAPSGGPPACVGLPIASIYCENPHHWALVREVARHVRQMLVASGDAAREVGFAVVIEGVAHWCRVDDVGAHCGPGARVLIDADGPARRVGSFPHEPGDN